MLQNQSELALQNQSSQFTIANQNIGCEEVDMSNDCNVADEEEEAISALQARQADQNQRLREN